MERDTLPATGEPEQELSAPNRLRNEKSPYLLQHAKNPVDWYPWGTEAFERAAREDKPVFLSIGYATCHWCHVMAHESFEDDEVAALLNRDFIAIKVDREERPDIDSTYMAACQQLTGQGGWPLTIIMTPEKKPFFAATYLPKERRFALHGLLELLPRVARAWREQRSELLRSADRITDSLRESGPEHAARDPDTLILDEGYQDLLLRFDGDNGGFGTAPKFPTPHVLLFLLRYGTNHHAGRAIKMAETTLDAMRDGGIWDHLGGGFHRYATDAGWRVPHFEKMLYDQALLLMAYTAAFLATGTTRYQKTAEEIITYVSRDLAVPEGAFASAEDADSAAGEGAYYLWSRDEIQSVLGSEDAGLAGRVYSLLPGGNMPKDGSGVPKNILYRSVPLAEIAASYGISEPALAEQLTAIRTQLFAARSLRPRPARDDKVLADANGLMIAALAQAGRAFKNREYTEQAERAMAFVLSTLDAGTGRLLHRYRDGEAAIPAFADDYAFVILALIELYESTFDPRYLAEAVRKEEVFEAHFFDWEHGGFFGVADDAEHLFGRKKECYDGAVPSANSVAMENLIRLSRLTGNPAYEERASELARAFTERVRNQPSAYCWLLSAIDRALGASQEIVIAGITGAGDTEAMIAAVYSRYLPDASVLFSPKTGPWAGALADLAPFTRGLVMQKNKATAYPCTGNTCSMPVTDPAELTAWLNQKKEET